MFNKCSRKSDGFTLAELLLTLIIIGIISAVALPGLRKNVYSKEFEAGFKKNYSYLKQAWGLAVLQERNNAIAASSSQTVLSDGIKRNMKVMKACTALAGCFTAAPRGSKPSNFPATISGDSFILSDGAAFVVKYDSTMRCDVNQGVTKNVCGLAWVDINGFDKPNAYGEDIYGFWLTEDGLDPADPKDFGRLNIK